MFEQAISRATRRALDFLNPAALPQDTYLAGGTAAALHLGHRISVDLDFFTPHPFFSPSLLETLDATGAFELERTAPDTILGKVAGVKFTIFRYRYRLLNPSLPFRGFLIASIDDIIAMKIAAIADRGTKRDFIDLYFFLQEQNRTLQQALELYDKKFKKLAVNAVHLSKSLIYFVDADQDEMPEMLKPVSWEEVKRFFAKEAKKLVWGVAREKNR